MTARHYTLATLSLLVLASCAGESSEPKLERTLRLLDQPLVVEATRLERPELAERLAGEEVWVLGEQVPRESWKREEGSQVERANLRLGCVGAPRRHPVSRRLERAGMVELEREDPQPRAGEFVLAGKWIECLAGTERPEALFVDYPTSPSQLDFCRVRLDAEDRLVTEELTLQKTARRVCRVGTGSDLVYQVELPAEAQLDLGFAVAFFQVATQADGLRLRTVEEGKMVFAVSVETEGGAQESVWRREVELLESQRYQDARVDLSAWSGELVRLHLTLERPDEEGEAWDSFGYWGEPVIWSRRSRGAPNVVLIVLDTLRADRLGCYGWERARTPRLDRLAEMGVRYADVMSASSWTLPSHASLFTSTYPSQHGLWNEQRLADSLDTIAEVLARNGYRTAAFSEGGFVSESYGLAQGFEFLRRGGHEASRTFANAARWIGKQQAPFFAFVQTYQVHSPYDPAPEFAEGYVREYEGELGPAVVAKDHDWGTNGAPPSEADQRYISDLYDAEVAEVDHALGVFLDSLEAAGLLDDTLVIVTSDHGEEFFDHGSAVHGRSLYQEQLFVPLIIYHKGHLEGGQLVEHPVHLVDIAPTITRAVGLATPEAWVGLPLDLEPPTGERPLFAPMRMRWFDQESTGKKAVALREGSLKYIDFPEGLRRFDSISGPALFDLATDPGETQNLLDPAEALRWAERASELRARYGPLAGATEVQVSEEALRELEKLGYAGQ